MPSTIQKIKGGFRVTAPNGAKEQHTTLEKAKAQKRLLDTTEHDLHPTGKKKG
jgi:hypothetical protein